MTEHRAEDGLGKRMRALRGEARRAAIGDVVGQWRASGQSQEAFCREAGIASVTLGRWLRELEAGREPPAKPAFVDLGVHQVSGREPYEIVLTCGIRVCVPGGFRESDLARLLGVLSRAC